MSTFSPARVLFLIDTSASAARKGCLETIDHFFAGLRSTIPAAAPHDVFSRIEIQAIRFADGPDWHLRRPTSLAALEWPPLVSGSGTNLGAALGLAATIFDDPSNIDVPYVVVLITASATSDDIEQGVADFDEATSRENVVRVAVAIEGCNPAVLPRFKRAWDATYVAGPGVDGLTDTLNRLFDEQIISRAAVVDDLVVGSDDSDCDSASGIELSGLDLDCAFSDRPDDAEEDEADICFDCPADEVQGSDATLPPDASHLDEVQFTVYRPKTVQPQEWRPLLAFVHLAEPRADARDSEPTPIEQVRQQAQALLGANAAEYRNTSADARHGIPKESEITLVPDIPGISFNPRSRTFRWEKDVHREEFDLRADPSLDGRTARGFISAYLGVILIARIDLTITVDSSYHESDNSQSNDPIRATPYRKIFASYSRRDTEIVRQFEHFIESTGDRFLQDVRQLRAGEKWDDGLLRLIDQADVFQLFWSSNSMASPHVRREWEYALSLGRRAFVRPTFWEDPFPESPADSLPPESLRRLHFHRLATVPTPPRRRNPRTSAQSTSVAGQHSACVAKTSRPAKASHSARLHRVGASAANRRRPRSRLRMMVGFIAGAACAGLLLWIAVSLLS